MKLPTLTRTRAIAAAAAVALVAGATGGGVAFAHRNDLPSDGVFRYAGQTITQAQLQQRIDVLGALYGVKAPTEAAKLDAFHRDAAKSMAVGMILQRAASDADIVISDKQARDQLDKLIGQQLAGDQQKFTDYLASSGISETDVLDEIKQQLATADLAEKTTASVAPVTDAMAQQTYDSKRADMVSPERRHLLNVVVASRADAERVLRQARAGVSFRVLAATWSQDTSTRSSGGDLGTVAASDLEGTYATAAFAAGDGQVFGPVRTQYGWNVGKVAGIVRSVPVPFAKMKSSLRAALLEKEKLDTWNAYLKGLLLAAHVTYADAYRPADPTALPSGIATSAAR